MQLVFCFWEAIFVSLIQVSDLSFTYENGFLPVFEHVSFRLDTDWKLGFIGRNGRGKTTFLRLLMGQYEYEGSITASTKFHYFPFPVKEPERFAYEVLETLPGSENYEFWQLRRELSRLQLDEEVLYRPFCSLSQGERTKLQLAVLFLQDGFYLIDEPTNHLDREARQLVSQYLNAKKGFILVSHDRRFLDSCIDHVLSINRADIEVQKGNFSSWYENRKRQDAWELAENERLKGDIRRLKTAAGQSRQWADHVEDLKIGRHPVKEETFIGTRSYLGEKSRKMQQRRKNLERRQERAIEEKEGLLKNVEQAESLKLMPLTHHSPRLVTLEEAAPVYRQDGQSGRELCCENAGEAAQAAAGAAAEPAVGAAEPAPGAADEAVGKAVCQPVSLEICPGDRVFLQGKNGCGKSSILHLILKNGPETLEHTGKIEIAGGLKISFVSQDTSALRGKIQDYARQYEVEESLLMTLLRKLDFPREQFEMPMETYSEGQKKKVLLARSLCEKAHLYIWDEPLNFIDIYSRIQLEELILTFQPTMILVEHDEEFSDRVATKRAELAAVSGGRPSENEINVTV